MELPVDKPTIAYIPRADATSETELNVLASVYRYVLLESNARKESARPGAPDDGTKTKEDSTSESIISN
jgi:hypothetical protein